MKNYSFGGLYEKVCVCIFDLGYDYTDCNTSGLNEQDINRLIEVINRLADHGETIVIIEHNIEFIARIADYLIDLGDKAGNAGGETIIEGSPKAIMTADGSSWQELMQNIYNLIQ